MAIVSANMGLMKWTALSDRFDYQELADNFEKIDAHDHTSGNGVQIPESGLAPLAVSESKIQDASVGEAKIVNNAVTGAKLKSSATVDADRAVSTNHIKDNAVTLDKMDADLTAEIDATVQAGIAQLSSLNGIQEQWREPIQTGKFDLRYTLDSSTSNSDPGTGEFRLNSSTLGTSITAVYIHKNDLNSVDITSTLSSVVGANKKAVIKIKAENGSYGIFRIDSYNSYGGVYFGLNVVHMESQGSLASIPSVNETTIEIYAIGLSNGWSGPVKYYRDTMDRVHIVFGTPATPATGPWNAEAFYLPEGYRPTESIWIPAMPGLLRVYPNGAVRPMNNIIGFISKDEMQKYGVNASYFVAGGSFRALNPNLNSSGQVTIQP